MRLQLLVLLATLTALPLAAQKAPAPVPRPAASAAQTSPPTGAPAPAFDPEAATEAYMAHLSPEQKARSDAYFEGGYWLQLWGFLYGLGVAWVFLATGLSRRLRDLAERLTRFGPLQTLLYASGYIVLATLFTFPLTLYQSFFREHRYGLSTQGFGAWLGDQGKGLAVGLVLGGLLLTALYGVLRRAPRTWWIWGSAVFVAFLAFVLVIAPVWIAPIFNRYQEVRDPAIRGPILSMARANGVAAEHVYEYDASRQTTRVSANVSGLLGTTRISLNDNLLRRGSPEEIQAVMGHELGHYVLHHVYQGLLFFAVVIVLGFAFLRWAFDRTLARWGSGWGVRGIGDLAGLPLLAALFSVYLFAMTPFINTFIRSNEAAADIFGLNASRQPDGAAQAALDLSEYRKMDPGPIEAWIFFDHPSGHNRILMAMRWKAEHLGETAAP